MDDTLKLFVWHNVLTNWASGVMFVLAHDVDEARKLLLEDWADYYKDANLHPATPVKVKRFSLIPNNG